MIDESHNLKDPLEDLIQATDALQVALAQALCVNRDDLADAQSANDPARAAEVLHRGFRTDVRPLVAEARRRNGAALDPPGHVPGRRLSGGHGDQPGQRRRGHGPVVAARPADGPIVVAVDFGASSIRVCRVDLGARPPAVEVVHRHGHGPVADGAGHLRWDWGRLVAEMDAGLAAAVARGPVASIGVDTWGVDYGLLDERGELVAPPFSYRDDRTAGYASVVAAAGGPAALYATTGSSSRRSTRSSRWQPTTGASWPGPPPGAAARAAGPPPHGGGPGRAHERRHDRPRRHHRRATGRPTSPRPRASTRPCCPRSPRPASGPGRGADPGPPGRRPRHRLGRGGHGRAPGPYAAFVSAGTWLLVGREQGASTSARRHGPATSPTRSVPWAASGS